MKKKCFILIFFSVSLQLFAQNEEIIINRDDFYWERVRTSDELYIYNDSHLSDLPENAANLLNTTAAMRKISILSISIMLLILWQLMPSMLFGQHHFSHG